MELQGHERSNIHPSFLDQNQKLVFFFSNKFTEYIDSSTTVISSNSQNNGEVVRQRDYNVKSFAQVSIYNMTFFFTCFLRIKQSHSGCKCIVQTHLDLSAYTNNFRGRRAGSVRMNLCDVLRWSW